MKDKALVVRSDLQDLIHYLLVQLHYKGTNHFHVKSCDKLSLGPKVITKGNN